MSNKKKEAQEARRAARRTMSVFSKDLHAKIGEINLILRPKPKYFPRALWRWVADKFVDIDAMEKSILGAATAPVIHMQASK